MRKEERADNSPDRANDWRRHLLRLSGIWVVPLYWILLWILAPSAPATGLVLLAACCLAPLPGRRASRALLEAASARQEAEQLKLQLQNVRFRTARLREELSAAGGTLEPADIAADWCGNSTWRASNSLTRKPF